MHHALGLRELPGPLEPLREMALDLRLVGNRFADAVWRRLDAETWERTHNPLAVLVGARRERLQEAAQDGEFVARLAAWSERRRATDGERWFGRTHGAAGLGTVAYFSMEFGLSEALPIYSGGLGILAGDHLKSAGDLGLPLVGVGLLYQQGYFRQHLAEDGSQLEAFPYNDPGSLPITRVTLSDGSPARVRLELPGRELHLGAWEARVGPVRLLLLDSNDPLNAPWDRGITAQLYAAGRDKRLLQEIVLGAGGWLLLMQLGIEPDVLHLNEGHAAFAVLARAATHARRNGLSFQQALAATRAGNVFTTHTPVGAAFDRFDPELITRYTPPFCERAGFCLEELFELGRLRPDDADEPFHMTYLALRGSGFVNGVSRLHARVSRELFAPLFPRWPKDEIPIGHVTNGVHVPTWDSGPAERLWERALGDGPWTANLEGAAEALARVPDADLWDLRAAARAELVEYVRPRLARQVRRRGAGPDEVRAAERALDPDILTLGFARRFTEYKRPNLLLRDPERLQRFLLDRARPAQLIVAGKAHPDDGHGKELVRRMASFAARPELRGRVVFLEDYDMVLAMHMAAGVDVWLNTPRRPAEACGTSGMKILANGGLHASVLDGWWDEAFADGLGWAIGARHEGGPEVDDGDALALYAALEGSIAPEFYGRDADNVPRAWTARMRRSMGELSPRFSSDRMVREYVERAYLPASVARRAREAHGGQLARELVAWHQRVADSWPAVHLGEVRVGGADGRVWADVQAYLGDLAPDEVALELYADPERDGAAAERVPLTLVEPLHGAVHGYRYRGEALTARPTQHFTPRIVPRHVGALPLEVPAIRWP